MGFSLLEQVEEEALPSKPPQKVPRRLRGKQTWSPAEPASPSPPMPSPQQPLPTAAATTIAAQLGLPTVPTPIAEQPACIQAMLDQEDDETASLQRAVRRLQQVGGFQLFPTMCYLMFRLILYFMSCLFNVCLCYL